MFSDIFKVKNNPPPSLIFPPWINYPDPHMVEIFDYKSLLALFIVGGTFGGLNRK